MSAVVGPRAYGVLWSMPGARRFILSGFLARLGTSMFGVAIISMIALRRDSFAQAGLVSAVGLIGMAAAGPFLGQLIDRRGQRVVGIPTTIASTIAIGLLALLTFLGAPLWAMIAANLGNAIMPNVGTMIRSRWNHQLGGDPARMHIANSFEQMVEEGCFVAGPALGGALATIVFPEAGVLLALACYLIGTLSLVSQSSTEPPTVPPGEHHTSTALTQPGILRLALVLSLTGAIFGSVDVTVLAFTAERGAQAWGGLILGCFAFGSLIGAMLTGMIALIGPIHRRLLWGTGAMFALLTPVLWIQSPFVLGPALLVAGLAIAPTMITGTLLTQRLVPTAQINEGMTVVMTGLLLGVSAGSALAGWVVQEYGAHLAFRVPLGAALLAALLAAAWQVFLGRAEQRALSLWGAPREEDPAEVAASHP